MQRIESSFTSPIVKKTVRFDPEIQKKQVIKDVLKKLKCIERLCADSSTESTILLNEVIKKIEISFMVGSYEFNKLMAKCLVYQIMLSVDNGDSRDRYLTEANRLDSTDDKYWILNLEKPKFFGFL